MKNMGMPSNIKQQKIRHVDVKKGNWVSLAQKISWVIDPEKGYPHVDFSQVIFAVSDLTRRRHLVGVES